MDDNFSKILAFSRQSGIPVKKITDVLFLIAAESSLDNTQIIQKTGLARNVVVLIRNANLKLPNENVKEYESEAKIYNFLENSKYKKVLEFLEKYQHLHPKPARVYDQFTATVSTVAKRASLMAFLGDLNHKRIAFLGDDDFTSCAVSKAAKSQSVVVFDIDKRILESVSQISKLEKFDITCQKYDARKNIPNQFRNKFDVVFTDPPYTPYGFSLFASRAIELLDSTNKAAKLYICYGNSDRAKERFIPIQRILTDCGLVQRYVFEKFNRYFGAESIGSSSNLYVCEVTPKTHAIIEGEFNENIYTL